MSRLFLLFTLCVHCVWCNTEYAGDACQTGDRKPGICMPINNCKKVLDGVNLDPPKTPTVCYYRQTVVFVCCPSPPPSSSSSSLSSSTIPSSKRVKKCLEYAEYVFETVKIPVIIPGRQPIIKKKNRCGRDGAPFILGGVDASPREYPHSALLGYGHDGNILWRCGGSLVSSRYVLTAGHCLMSDHYGSVNKVRLGELDYNSTVDDATPIDFNIEKIIPFPVYIKKRNYHDIALLKLSETVKLSPYIRPICLPTENIEPNEYIATGWGFTKSYDKEGSASLLKVRLQSFPYEECKNAYRYNTNRKLPNGIQPSQLCAGHRTEVRDTCNGDSGGPLQIFHPKATCSYIQYGVTSFGIACGMVNFPGVYTRVFEYADWIESIIWAPGEDF